jgi:riboflavin synthase
MFTGIVEETGVVESIRSGKESIQLTLRSKICGAGLKVGDSLAVNGCCLTLVGRSGLARRRSMRFDLLRETWIKTNLQFVKPGTLVNLERPLQANGRLDGHFVTGHVDGMGRIQTWERKGKDHVLDISAPTELLRHVVYKGSIAVDGVSLTVAQVRPRSFRIWIIPHTYSVTALQERKRGDSVNLETDILGKYVDRLVSLRAPKFTGISY